MKRIVIYLLLPVLLLAVGCAEKSSEMPANETTTQQIPELQTQLDSMLAAFEERAPKEKIDLYNEGIMLVEATGVVDSALQQGEKAVPFTLPSAQGDSVTLYEALTKGPVVLTWYRGGWCPYCNMQLRVMQEALPAIEAAGGSLIAVSPEMPDSSLSTAERHALSFKVLSDPGNKVAGQYGIVYSLPGIIKESYSQSFDMADYNADESWTLPLGATYIVDTDGTIAYAFLDADYKKRAEPAEIVRVLEELQTK